MLPNKIEVTTEEDIARHLSTCSPGPRQGIDMQSDSMERYEVGDLPKRVFDSLRYTGLDAVTGNCVIYRIHPS